MPITPRSSRDLNAVGEYFSQALAASRKTTMGLARASGMHHNYVQQVTTQRVMIPSAATMWFWSDILGVPQDNERRRSVVGLGGGRAAWHRDVWPRALAFYAAHPELEPPPNVARRRVSGGLVQQLDAGEIDLVEARKTMRELESGAVAERGETERMTEDDDATDESFDSDSDDVIAQLDAQTEAIRAAMGDLIKTAVGASVRDFRGLLRVVRILAPRLSVEEKARIVRELMTAPDREGPF